MCYERRHFTPKEHPVKRILLAVCLVASACESPTPDSPDGVAANARDNQRAPSAAATFQRCTAGFSPARHSSWRHWTSRITSALASPVHSASDVIVQPGATASLQARFAYGGILSKELEDEWVWVFVDDCSGVWHYAGYALTNDEGRVTFNLAGGLPPGQYDVRMEVVGDATWVPLTLWVLPSGTHVSVFDMDGTLTTDDAQVVEQILLGHTPAAYPAATDLTWAEYGRGEIVLYLTARPEILAGKSRGWLDGLGFADGVVHLASNAADVLPTNSGAGDYKVRYLQSLTAAGLKLDDAFGNATSDVYAYSHAAIPVARTWIIGPNAGSGGTHGVTGSWAAVAAQIGAEAPAPQPFHW
jgi:hypothetical protein